MFNHAKVKKRFTQVPPEPPRFSTLPLGDLVETVSKSSLKAPAEIQSAKITDVDFVASYNWIGDGATIMIPGKPPKWTPPVEHPQLSTDSGTYYRDLNSASFPNHPLEAAIVSIMEMQVRPLPVNIVACGSTIGNLLRFANATKIDRTFRMLVEVVGDTAHFIRREESPKELIPNVKGFGHSFPEAYTTWDKETRGSTTHQRILRYKFGGLDMMIRFEGDGFIDPSPHVEPPATTRVVSTGDPGLLPDDLLSGLVIEKPIGGSRAAETRLQVVNGGEIVPQEDIFDLKTRSAFYHRGKDTLGEQLPRLWISQIQQFILAFHENRVFRDINIKNVADDVAQWEDKNQADLMRLAGLLHLIVDRARSSRDAKLEVVYQPGSTTLEIRKQVPGSGDVLSAPVMEEWKAWLRRATLSELGSDDGEWDSPILCFSSEDDTDRDDIDDGGLDFAACDRECGYCGRCDY